MGVNLAELVNGCPRQSEQAMVYLDVFFSDDTAVIAMDKIIDIGDAARRGIFNGQDAVADLPRGHGLDDVFKMRVIGRLKLPVMEIEIHGFIRIGSGPSETSDTQLLLPCILHYRHRPFADSQTSRMAQAAAASTTGTARWTMHGSWRPLMTNWQFSCVSVSMVSWL